MPKCCPFSMTMITAPRRRPARRARRSTGEIARCGRAAIWRTSAAMACCFRAIAASAPARCRPPPSFSPPMRCLLHGHRAFSSQSRCWPGGTPGQSLFPAEPIYFIQTPKEVWIIWQRQQEVRRIYLDVPHSVGPKPSWFGESVGHYENGELVVDTTGFLDKHEFDFVDNWRTPHTKDMHVVERFKLIDGGKGLEATVTVDDPGTFNQPWSGTVRWQRVNRRQEESICAENNQAFEKYFSNQKEYPMPQAKATDF